MSERHSLTDMANNVMWMTASQPLMNWMSVQGEISSRLGEMAATWGQDRLRDAEAAQSAVRRMSGTRDVNEIAAIYGEWLHGTMERAARDLSQYASRTQELMGTALPIVRPVQPGEMTVGKEAAKATAKAAE